MGDLRALIEGGRFGAALEVLRDGAPPPRGGALLTRVCGARPEPDQRPLAEALLAAGAGVNEGAADGGTPLMAATRTGDAALVRVLLAHGADIYRMNRRGETALSIAVREGRREILQLIVGA